MKKKLMPVIFLFSMPFAFCNQDKASNNKWVYQKSTSIDSFNKLIKFPYTIKSVKWEVQIKNNENDAIPGPSDELICAEIKCDSTDLLSLKDSIAANRFEVVDNVYLNSHFIKDWFSENTKAVFYKKEDYLGIRNKVYRSDQKFPGNSTFFQGWFTIIDANRVFIFLWTS